MSGDYSDGEGSVRHEADFVDATADTEVDLRLPLEVDMQPDQLWEDVPAYLLNADRGPELRRPLALISENSGTAEPGWPVATGGGTV